jgi:hypothetical protein
LAPRAWAIQLKRQHGAVAGEFGGHVHGLRNAADSEGGAVDDEDHCPDCDETKRISGSEAYEITKRIMNGKPVTALQNMDQDARNKILRSLRNDGLSLRQICRITGLSFHIVRKA